VRYAAAVLLCVGLAARGGVAQVELRGGVRVDAPVQESALIGVRVGPEAAGGAPRVIGWDRVKRVEGDAAKGAERFASVADKLWRMRTRVERGDHAAAEVLLDELAQTYASEGGPSAALVAECALRCRLARGAQGAATSAWLWWTWVHESPIGAAGAPASAEWIGGGTDLAPVVDAGTGLVPSLPPVWAPVGSTSAAATSAEWSKLKARAGAAAELADLYERAARFEAGMDAEIVLTGPASDAAGVSLVRDIVLARGGDTEVRAAARASLERRLADMGPRPDNSKSKAPPAPRWMEAWCRAALGRSLIREADNALRMRGVIELLHLPARFAADQPFLAGLALADAAVTMADVGDDSAAAALKGELLVRYPAHPVTRWERLGKIKEPSGGGQRSPDA
jgi:hypothetical protein